MSSDLIDYDDSENFDLKLENMSKEELINFIKYKNFKLKQYVKKYINSEKGKQSVRKASKKYYEANKEEILQKKREKYHSNKLNKNI